MKWLKLVWTLCLVMVFGIAVGAGEGEGDADMEDPLVAKLVVQARTDLAERLEIGEDAVEVVSAARVTWRDSSLGCPKPDTMYMQMLQPGVRIELEAEGKLFPYHSNLQGPPFYCETPSSTPPLPADEE